VISDAAAEMEPRSDLKPTVVLPSDAPGAYAARLSNGDQDATGHREDDE